MELMKTPFLNDPFAMVYQAYQKMYGKPFTAYYNYRGEGGSEEEYGFTEFSEDRTPVVIIYADYPIGQQVEIFAHELAHIAVGFEHGHDAVWEAAFETLCQEYSRMGEELATQ